jgi:hypothetical protein
MMIIGLMVYITQTKLKCMIFCRQHQFIICLRQNRRLCYHVIHECIIHVFKLKTPFWLRECIWIPFFFSFMSVSIISTKYIYFSDMLLKYWMLNKTEQRDVLLVNRRCFNKNLQLKILFARHNVILYILI